MRVIAALFVAFIACPAASQTQGSVVILADRLLDVRAGRYVAAPRIEVEDSRITRVTPDGHALGAWLSMDIYNTEYTQAEGKKNGVLEEVLKKDQEIAEIQREAFRRAHTAGARMIFGTDAGIYPHGQNAKQFAVMMNYGMTPLDAIRTATINAAEALGNNDVGIAEPGRYADFVAVFGDPLADVSVLEDVAAVIKGGTLIEH